MKRRRSRGWRLGRLKLPETAPLDVPGLTDLLLSGKITTCDLVPWSSNYTFLVEIDASGGQYFGIYKPKAGETPLWDFPEGTLYQREYAAYLVSEALSWSLVPPTVVRQGPHGIGSVQLYVDADPEEHYFTLDGRFAPTLRRFALFDSVVNNADRKGGHCLLDRSGRLWALDHGLTFHAQPKLRTVIWDFHGHSIPGDLLADLRRLATDLVAPSRLAGQLSPLLSSVEMAALRQRVKNLIDRGTFPEPGTGRNVPWPLV